MTDTAESQVPGSDGNIRPPLPILAKPTYDRAPLSDATLESSAAAVEGSNASVRTKTVPFVPMNIPDPFELQSMIRLQQPLVEDSQPMAVTPAFFQKPNEAGKAPLRSEPSMKCLAGSLLIAKPVLKDSFFEQSVILLLQHSEEGAFGVVLNRPAPVKDLPFPLFIGGPCKLQGLVMIHGQPDWVEPEERQEVCTGLYLGNAECIRRISELDEGHHAHFRVFTGYAGWGPFQLERELSEGSWAVVHPPPGNLRRSRGGTLVAFAPPSHSAAKSELNHRSGCESI